MTRPPLELPSFVITGFMATGKSAVARELAELTGLELVDTDFEIQRRSGSTIMQIFRQQGEAHFRQLEREVCAELENRRGVVVATGGGTLLDEHNLARFRGAHIFCLDVPVDQLVQRLRSDSSRPLVQTGETTMAVDDDDALRQRLQSLYESREANYARLGRHVNNFDRTEAETAAVIAAMVDFPTYRLAVDPLRALGVEGVPVRGRFGHSQIDIGRGALCDLGRRLDDLDIASRAFVLLPPDLEYMFRTQITASLEAVDIPHTFVNVHDGDSRKNMEQVNRLLDALVAEGAHRDATIVALGGGVTGDIAGFTAATYMRGLPFVQVPTTLLAQVDASIGGKVGVNHAAAKNLIGSFYQPHLVISDPLTLRTLSGEELANGMAEVIKSALIGSSQLFDYLLACMETPFEEKRSDTAFLEHCVIETAAIKCHIVNMDPFETGRRRVLNLGHTAGHAVEKASNYGLRHGEAVAIGLVAALRVAMSRGVVEGDVLQRTTALLQWCGLPARIDDVEVNDVVAAMRLDKKVRSGRLHFVMPAGIGSVRIVDDVTIDEVVAALEIS